MTYRESSEILRTVNWLHLSAGPFISVLLERTYIRNINHKEEVALSSDR